MPVLTYDPGQWDESFINSVGPVLHLTILNNCELAATYEYSNGLPPVDLTFTATIGHTKYLVGQSGTTDAPKWRDYVPGAVVGGHAQFILQMGDNPQACILAAEQVFLLSDASIQQNIGP